jgi:pimeloyl-ACP methyl ester carboxylesterase
MSMNRFARLAWIVILLADAAIAVGRPAPGNRKLPGYIRGDRSTPAPRVIVFVHGAFGDGEETWTNATTGAYFPELLLDDELFQDANIWVHHYPRGYLIGELADHLRRQLSHDNVIFNHGQVIFVAHSMGGLVVREYLVRYRDQIPTGSVPMLYFYSTPSTGAALANVGAILTRDPSLRSVRRMKTGKPGDIATLNSHWNISSYPRSIRSYCAYETLKTYGVYVVQRDSAEHLCNSTLDPLAYNHFDVVKPADREDDRYISFRNAFRETFKASSNQGPIWNTFGNRPNFLRVSKAKGSPRCDGCWSSTIDVTPGEHVFVAAHYENHGSAAARDVRLHLNVPDSLNLGELIFGKLTASEGDPLQGAACVIQSKLPLVFMPVGGEWYPNSASTPTPLPYDQSEHSVLSKGGLELGDVSRGIAFESDVVIEFKTVGVTALAVRDVAPLIRQLERSARAGGGMIDVQEVKALLSTSARISRGSFDYGSSFETRGWVSDLKDLKLGERIMLCVFIHNPHPQPLHSARLVMTLGQDESRERFLRIRVESRELSWDVAESAVTYTSGATALSHEASFMWPYGYCPPGRIPFSATKKLSRDGGIFEGLPLGDLAAEDVAIYGILFEVQ